MKTLKKHPQKLHTYGSLDFFFSAAPTAQNIPELIIRFINVLFFFSERRHYKLFHALRDLQMSWTEFTKEFVYLLVYFWKLLEHFGTFWKKAGEFELNLWNLWMSPPLISSPFLLLLDCLFLPYSLNFYGTHTKFHEIGLWLPLTARFSKG